MYRIAHSVLEHRLGAASVVTFITKRAGLLRQKEVVRFFGRQVSEGAAGLSA